MEIPSIVNSAGIMGDLVYKYETLIRPTLVSGEVDGLGGIISDVLTRGQIAENISRWNTDAYARYVVALTYLAGFLKELQTKKQIDPESQLEKMFLNCLDRETSELDFIMQNNPEYEKERQRRPAKVPEKYQKMESIGK